MILARFNIQTPFRPPRGGYVMVMVHDTAADLRRAAHAYSPDGGVDEDLDTVGCFQPAPWRFDVAPDGSDKETTYRPFVGIVRLSRGHVNTNVVTHEVTHAACWTMRHLVLRYGRDLNLGDNTTAEEEDLAYVVGHLAAQLSTVLFERALWD